MAIFNQQYLYKYLKESLEERDNLDKKIKNYQRNNKAINTQLSTLEKKEFEEGLDKKDKKKIESLKKAKNTNFNIMDKMAGKIKNIDYNNIAKPSPNWKSK